MNNPPQWVVLFINVLTIDDSGKEWDPGGDGSEVRRANLVLSPYVDFVDSKESKEDWVEEFLWSSIFTWFLKFLLISIPAVVGVCWVVIPPADVRLVAEDKWCLNQI